MLAIYKREVRSYFNSMIGCVFAAFLTIIGGIYFMVYNLYSGYPFFAYSLAGVIFMLLISVPVLSMKSFAEDRKNKTDQLLLTSPVSLVEIVLGKYLAMVTVFAIPCVIYCIFPLIIKLQGTAHFLVVFIIFDRKSCDRSDHYLCSIVFLLSVGQSAAVFSFQCDQ